MDKKDMTISADDLGEIFGEDSGIDLGDIFGAGLAEKESPKEQPVKNVSPPVPEIKKEKPMSAPQKSAIITTTKVEEMDLAVKTQKEHEKKKIIETKKITEEHDEEHGVDDFIQRAKEIESQIGSKANEPGVNETEEFTGFLQESSIGEVLEIFDDIRAIISDFLSSKLLPKAVKSMLVRTLEKTAVNFLILRNTNWGANGQLKEEGEINADKFLQNIKQNRDQIFELEKEIGEALKTILYMRMKSIKLGTTPDVYENIKNMINKKMDVIAAGYKKDVIIFVKDKIFCLLQI